MLAVEYITKTEPRQLRAQKMYKLKQAEPKTRLKGTRRSWVQPPREIVCNCPHYGQKSEWQLRVVRLPSTQMANVIHDGSQPANQTPPCMLRPQIRSLHKNRIIDNVSL